MQVNSDAVAALLLDACPKSTRLVGGQLLLVEMWDQGRLDGLKAHGQCSALAYLDDFLSHIQMGWGPIHFCSCAHGCVLPWKL